MYSFSVRFLILFLLYCYYIGLVFDSVLRLGIVLQPLFIILFFLVFIRGNIFTNKQTNKYIWFSAWAFLMTIAFQFCAVEHYPQTFLGIVIDGRSTFFISLFFILSAGMLIVDKTQEQPIIKLQQLNLFLFIMIICNFLFTLRAIWVFPDAIRARSTTVFLGYEQILWGTPSYSMVYGSAILVPIVMENIASCSRVIHRLFWLICFGDLILSIYLSNFFTAFLGTLVGVFLYLWIKLAKYKIGSIIILLLIITIIFMSGNFLSFLIDWVGIDTTIGRKLNDLMVSLQSKESSGDVAGRAEMYEYSIAAFKNNILLGNLGGEVMPQGSHSTLLDILGISGLLGLGIFTLFGLRSFFQIYTPVFVEKYKALILSSYCIFIIFYVSKSIITAYCPFISIFVILPLYIFLRAKQSQVIKLNSDAE